MSDSEAPVERPMSLFGAAAWACAFVLLWIGAAALTESFKPRETLDVVNATACIVLAYSVVLFAMLRVHSPDASIREVLGLRTTSPLGVLCALASGAALYPAASLVDEWFRRAYPFPEDAAIEEHMPALQTMGQRVVVVIAIFVVVPIFEELFYRGMTFAGLRRGRAEGAAVLGCTAIFALVQAQIDARLAASAVLLGLLTSWLRARSGSLAAAIGAHLAYSAVPSVMLLMRKDDVELGSRAAVAGIVGAAVAAGIAGVIFRRDARAERGRLLDA